MSDKKLEIATLGGGCFWCVEAVYLQLDGIEKVVSGYAGGHTPNPTYQQIGTKKTGHAEVIQITYDADKWSFAGDFGNILAFPQSNHSEPTGK